MNLSQAGLSFIKRHEGFRATPYDDGYGNLTIGYGHVILPHESFSRISEAEALNILARDVGESENAVNSLVRVPLTQNQFDALVSLVFNWGSGHFSNSLLLQRLNAGDYAGAAQRLGEHPVTSGGVFVQGLANRRAAEKALFLSGTTQAQSGQSGQAVPSWADRCDADGFCYGESWEETPPTGTSLTALAIIGGIAFVVIFALMDD